MTIFVVVKSVAMPPKIVPNASGIIKRELLTEAFLAAPETAGSSTEAAAILFIKSDRKAPAIITTTVKRSSLRPPILTSTALQQLRLAAVQEIPQSR